MRKIQFANNEYYHVFNKCIGESKLFRERNDYLKFLRDLRDLNNESLYGVRQKIIESQGFERFGSFLEDKEKMVDIISYSLSPNHYHLILRQLKDSGISQFMHKTGIGCTGYLNKKYKRSGSIFQGPYKIIHINSNEYLLWLSGYVNGNIEIHKTSDAETYEWSSYQYFLGLKNSEIMGDINMILSQFSSRDSFKDFTKRVIRESQERKDLKKYLLESDSVTFEEK